jgi:hypothetical protein
LSLQRSGRGGSRPTPQRGTGTRGTRGAGGVFVQTPRSDIFVVLLGVSLGAIVLGCLLLLLVLNRYGFSSKATAMAETAPRTTLLAASEKSHDFSTVRL